MVARLYPPTQPYEQGMLAVGDGNHVYWAASGNPHGVPALLIHGGPGNSSSAGARRYFDPDRYRIIQFDQRGCGRSTPHASDPTTDLRHNTTHHLVADMEMLRRHLRVDRWLLYGLSWGSTLALAYAQRHPDRVRGIVLQAVTTCSRREIDWLYAGVGRYLPDQRARFRAGAGLPDSDTGDASDVLTAYARLMEHPDAAVRARTANHWWDWELAVLSVELRSSPDPDPGASTDPPPPDRLALVRICAHYLSHHAWLTDDEVLRGADQLASIPGVLVHGRLDLGGPVETAWRLARAWPGSRLIVVDDAGHLGSDTMLEHVLHAVDGFARR